MVTLVAVEHGGSRSRLTTAVWQGSEEAAALEYTTVDGESIADVVTASERGAATEAAAVVTEGLGKIAVAMPVELISATLVSYNTC